MDMKIDSIMSKYLIEEDEFQKASKERVAAHKNYNYWTEQPTSGPKGKEVSKKRYEAAKRFKRAEERYIQLANAKYRKKNSKE